MGSRMPSWKPFPLDDQICEEVAREAAPCLPEEFLAAYVIRVGVVRAGATILGAWMGDHARRWAGFRAVRAPRRCEW
jgi:hypothetical protein